MHHTQDLSNSTFLITGGAGFIGSNIDGFLNMLVAVKDNGNVKRMVFAASSSTYGDSQELPKVEGNEGNPLSPYAITKLVNEVYANVFSKVYGLHTIGLRYFNIFGPERSGDVRHSLADISKANRLFGYEPKWEITEGLKQAFQYYKENL